MQKWFYSAAIAALMTAAAAGAQTPPEGEPGTTPAEATATPENVPTVDDARAFLSDAEAELAEYNEYASRVYWVYENFITFDTERLVERVGAEGTEMAVRLANGTAPFANIELPEDLRRKMTALTAGITLPAPSSDGAATELAAITTRMSSAYSTGTIEVDGETVPLNELEVLMRTERNPEFLANIWNDWRAAIDPDTMAADYARMVEITNEGARELGFDNLAEMWLSNYDMPADEMEAEVERLWGQVSPLYEQLHCYVRAELNEEYGDEVQPETGPIRADILGNMWAQGWSGLYDIVAPEGGGEQYDLTQLLVDQEYDALRMVETGEAFFSSLGLAELPDTFWERSLFTRPEDRDVVCHASAWDLDSQEDIRIKMCISINADDFRTVHHELGHNYYQRAYRHQDTLFQTGAHDGFHEAIGDFIALSITPDYLVQIGVLDESQVPDESADTGLLLEQALDKIAFLPFGYLMDQWRWQIFRGETTPDEYNSSWWELRERIQGVTPPVERPANAFDPGAKYHIPNNVPYLRYFLAHILQYQFHQAACEMAGWEGPLHRCSIYGNAEVGERFNAMLEMGASQPWPDALEAFTGTREMDGSAIIAYFQPLMTYLEEENEGRTCGW